MTDVDDNDRPQGTLRKLAVPAAVSAAGAAAGLLLSNPKRVKDALPDLGDHGVGDVRDDLMRRVSGVFGKSDAAAGDGSRSSSTPGRSRRFDAAEFQSRRQERAERRAKRRGR